MLNSGIRRFALLMVIAVVAVASCVKDTLKETNNGSAIDFRMATLTRAVESTAVNIDAFYVTARIPGVENNYFTDIPYLKGAGDVFYSAEPYYWPAAGDLQFYAYCPSLDNFGSAATLEISANSQKVTNFVTASSFDEQKDFVVATETASKSTSASGVELCFEHKLSQIEVHAKNANPGYKYSVKGIMIGGMASKGDFNLSPATGESEWVVDKEANPVLVYEIYDELKEIGPFATNIMGQGGNAMLIPQQLTPYSYSEEGGSFIAVYAQVRTVEGALVYPRPKNGDNNSYNWLVVPIDTEWQSGYKYIYTLDFSNGAGTDFSGVPVLGDKIHFAVDEIKWNPTASVQSTAADFVGTWDMMKCESWRTYYLESNDVPQSVKDYMDSWPPYAMYDTDDDLSNSGVVSPEMRRTRVLDQGNKHEILLYPGIDGWETTLGFRIEGDFLCITAYYNGLPVQDNKYLIIDYTKDTFTVYSGELNEREYNGFSYDYFMEKIFYYKKVSDNEAGSIDGKWKLDRGSYFSVYSNPQRINIDNIDSRLKYLDITLEENGNGLLNGEATTIENNEFTLDSTTYTFTDIMTSTMLVKYDYNGSDVGYLYYSRVE